MNNGWGIKSFPTGPHSFAAIFSNFRRSPTTTAKQILKERGYIIKERGVIAVKGKGEMNTFYVLGRKISRGRHLGATLAPGGQNSLAEVVYGMVRARKRRTAKKGEQGQLSFFGWGLGNGR